MENNNIEVVNKTIRNNLHNLPMSSTMDEAVNLLVSWNLSQLCDKFREQEVCSEAFQYITETDICQLVPKLGPRSIFRARLSEWREKKTTELQTNLNINVDHSKTTPTTTLNNNNIIETTTPIKVESLYVEDQWIQEVENVPASPKADSLLDTLSSAPNSTRHVERDLDVLNESDFLAEEEKTTINHSTHSHCKHKDEVLIVKDILNNCLDGRKAIAYYRSCKTLDANHRKKIVKCVISVAIEKRINMTVKCFSNLAQQFIELFPNEKFDTYYVERTRLSCPKGSLYNKYLNLCRRLRREGVLEYRIQRKRRNAKGDAMDQA